MPVSVLTRQSLSGVLSPEAKAARASVLRATSTSRRPGSEILLAYAGSESESENEGSERMARIREEPPSVLLASLTELEDAAVRSGLTFRFFSLRYLSRLVFSMLFFFGCCYTNTLASVVAG